MLVHDVHIYDHSLFIYISSDNRGLTRQVRSADTEAARQCDHALGFPALACCCSECFWLNVVIVQPADDGGVFAGCDLFLPGTILPYRRRLSQILFIYLYHAVKKNPELTK